MVNTMGRRVFLHQPQAPHNKRRNVGEDEYVRKRRSKVFYSSDVNLDHICAFFCDTSVSYEEEVLTC